MTDSNIGGRMSAGSNDSGGGSSMGAATSDSGDSHSGSSAMTTAEATSSTGSSKQRLNPKKKWSDSWRATIADSTTCSPASPSEPTVPEVVAMGDHEGRDPLAGQPHIVLHADVAVKAEVKEEFMEEEEQVQQQPWKRRRNSAGSSPRNDASSRPCSTSCSPREERHHELQLHQQQQHEQQALHARIQQQLHIHGRSDQAAAAAAAAAVAAAAAQREERLRLQLAREAVHVAPGVRLVSHHHYQRQHHPLYEQQQPQRVLPYPAPQQPVIIPARPPYQAPPPPPPPPMNVPSPQSASSRSSSEVEGAAGGLQVGGGRSRGRVRDASGDSFMSHSDGDDVRAPSRSDLARLIPPDCPLSYLDIVNDDIDTFNDNMGRFRFTEEAVSTFREIRRKGKNRQAAKKSRQKRMARIEELRESVAERRHINQQLQAREQMFQGLLQRYRLSAEEVREGGRQARMRNQPKPPQQQQEPLLLLYGPPQMPPQMPPR